MKTDMFCSKLLDNSVMSTTGTFLMTNTQAPCAPSFL